jgi:hypothetical protein
MSAKYKVLLHDKPNVITLTLVGWIDLFIRPVYTKILDDALRYYIKSKGLLVHAFIYIASHLYLIVTAKKEDINTIIKDFKKHTRKKLIQAILAQCKVRSECMLNQLGFKANSIKRHLPLKPLNNYYL